MIVLQIFESAFYKFESSPRFTNLSPVRVLQIWVQSAFYKFESSPRFTNLSPVRVLQIWVQSAFYKSSPVRVLQHAAILQCCVHENIRFDCKCISAYILDHIGHYDIFTTVTTKWKPGLISLSHAMRPGLQIRHFWVAKSLFLTITFHQKKQDKTFCF